MSHNWAHTICLMTLVANVLQEKVYMWCVPAEAVGEPGVSVRRSVDWLAQIAQSLRRQSESSTSLVNLVESGSVNNSMPMST